MSPASATALVLRTMSRRCPGARQSSSLAAFEGEVRIRTCSKVYSQQSDRKLFRNCPRNGIEMDVQFVDTGLRGQKSTLNSSTPTPTVLALHGTPGTFNDFSGMIEHLVARGVRVVSVNYPSMSYTDATGHFWHTTEERSEFLVDFVRALDLVALDSVVMHSSSCFSGLKFVTDEVVPVRSVALVNPAGHRRIKAMKPEWLIANMVRMNLTLEGRKLFNKYAPPILKLAKVAVKSEGGHLNNAVWAAMTMELAQPSRMVGYLNSLRKVQMPTLCVYSDNDKLVDKKISEEMAALLGAQESQVSRFDKNSELVSGPTLEDGQPDWLKVMSFATGGHYALIKQGAQVNQATGSLIEHLLRHKTPYANFRGVDSSTLAAPEALNLANPAHC